MRVAIAMQENIDFGLYICARGNSHAHVRVAKSRASILYTNMQPRRAYIIVEHSLITEKVKKLKSVIEIVTWNIDYHR